MLAEPIVLEGRVIRLLPLSVDQHALLCAIGLEPALWQHTTIRVQTPDDMRRYIEKALDSQAAGAALSFVIVLQATGQIPIAATTA